MKEEKILIAKEIEETEKIAKIFLEKILEDSTLKPGARVVGLVGDLGAGKTTFMQSVAKHLGVKDKVRSPTFVIMKKYPLPKHFVYKNFLANKTKPVSAGENFYKQNAFNFLFHLDAYRLKNEKELLALGWEEIINDKKNLVFIEWPENVSKIIPAQAEFVYISNDQDQNRLFKFSK
jgi:tRNA threonylcarbamoyladenosine biosynthesis protein TsaE